MGYADKLRLLLDWAPVINLLMAISAAPAGKDRVYRALEMLDYLASKTPTPIDNEVLSLVRRVLLTPEGAALLDYLAAALQRMFALPPAPQGFRYEPQ